MDATSSHAPNRGRLLSRLSTLTAGLLLTALAVSAQESKLATEAKRAFDAGRFQEAGRKYAKAAETEGLSAEQKSDLAFRAAWAYFIAGNSRAARENLRTAFTARPRLEIVADFYSPDFVRLAQTVRAEVVAPSSAPAADIGELKRTARDKLADGKPEEALYDLKKAEGSTDPQVHRLLADAYDRLGRTAEADAERRRVSDLEHAFVTAVPIAGAAPSSQPPGSASMGTALNVATLLEAAESSLRSGDYRKAQAMAARALDADSKNADAHRLLGDAALGLGQEPDAEREYTASIVLDPANSRAEYGLGRLAERQKKWNTAASHYRRALELNARSVAAALGLGRSMEAVDKTAARIAYGRAIEIDPMDASARNDFGVFLFRSGDLERAIAELIEAVRLAPQQPVFHENLGRAYRKQQKGKEAERELAEATRLAPNETAAWATLGHLRSEQKRFEEAATAYRAALDLDPTSEEAASGLSVALAQTGRFSDAETALSRTLESVQKSPALWNDLGVVRVQMGNFSGAVEAFGRALGLDGEFETAKTNLVRAEQLAALDRAAS
ncbi:MAG: tetratricopeptide repeat protein [Thermoanaerobaculia bacterium]